MWDDDGFTTDQDQPITVPRAPITVEVPKFFAGCINNTEATIKVINELTKPFSVQLDGMDTFYRRIADALIMVLANQKDISP